MSTKADTCGRCNMHRLDTRMKTDTDPPGVNADDARQALDTARAIVDAAKSLLDSGRLQPFVEE